MKAGAAHPVARLPSRPASGRPPFAPPRYPLNFPSARSMQEGPSTQVHRPVPQENRSVEQQNRPMEQDFRPVEPGYRPVEQDLKLVGPDNRPVEQEYRQNQDRRYQGGPRPGRGRGQGRRRRPDRAGPREPPDDNDCERMVQVTGFPKFTQIHDLMHVFEEFGAAKVERTAANTATLVFSGPEEAAAAVRASTTLYVYGDLLTVQPYTRALAPQRAPRNNRETDKGKQKGPTVDPNTLSWEGPFDAQLDALLKAVRLTQSELQQISALYEDLDSVLKREWPGCVTIPFGSITTGLGVKSSDADCFVLLPEDGPGASPRSHAVQRTRRLLSRHPHLFTSIVSIPNANTPIVKFYHLPTKTLCDVSFKTTLGVRNSKLISYLLSVDPRLIPVAIFLKYWASVHELSGTGKLTNYALSMLLIFYLQQPPDPILPPVAWLQRDPAAAHIVDEWDTGIVDHPDRLPPSTNLSSVADLIGGFFQFYSEFNFSGSVVCPYLGRALEKNCFRNNQLPEEFQRYEANVKGGFSLPLRHGTPLCVQDPFEQCHNVASSVTSRLAADITKYFKFAADTYEAEKSRDHGDFLRTILLERPKLPRTKSKAEFRVAMHPISLLDLSETEWRAVAKNAIELMFNSILQLQLDPVQKPATREDDIPQFPPINPKKVKYTGVITRAIWKRKQFSKLYSAMRLTLCDREKCITQEIMTTNNNVLDIPFQLIITYNESPRGVILTVRSRAADLQTFKEFGKFFRSVTYHWFAVLVKSDNNNKLPTASSAEYKDFKPEDENDENAIGIDEYSSDSDTDSTEDERTPDVQTNRQSDGEKSPSDTDKENVEATNVASKIASTEKPKDHKTQNDKAKNHKNKNNPKKS